MTANMIRSRADVPHGIRSPLSEEAPAREATVGAFLMDACTVTNEEFARFVDDTSTSPSPNVRSIRPRTPKPSPRC
jgi:formylglycine-generating enzyme required for sulfatase activity